MNEETKTNIKTSLIARLREDYAKYKADLIADINQTPICNWFLRTHKFGDYCTDRQLTTMCRGYCITAGYEVTTAHARMIVSEVIEFFEEEAEHAAA